MPVVDGSSYCGSYVTGSTGQICAQTIPAGPGNTGLEQIPADIMPGTAGNQPSTVALPSVYAGSLNGRVNRLIGGDFATNLWQWGTTPISAGTPTSATMGPDGFWVYSSGNTVTVTKQTGASDIIPSQSLLASVRVNRPSGTDVTSICIGQTLDKQAFAPLVGNNAVFSFWALAGSAFSPTGSNITVHVAAFTAADGSASQSTIQFAGTNGKSSALGTTTGYTEEIGGLSPVTPAGSVTSGIATIPISTTWTRYGVYAPIPATISSNAVTGGMVSVCMTPAASTGTSNDYFELAGVQLQALPGTATANMPNGATNPTGFEKRAPAVEQALEQYYMYVINESATVVNFRGICAGSTTSIANCVIPFPTQMRLAPAMKYTAGFIASATTASTSSTACTGLATSDTLSGNAATKNAVLVKCTTSAGTPAAGTAFFLWDAGTGSPAGVISASALP
jgi:hypothetical protein